jgi:hypothetical protein
MIVINVFQDLKDQKVSERCLGDPFQIINDLYTIPIG